MPAHKLITKELRKKLPPLYSTEEIECDDKVAIVKFFTPTSNWTWYAVEAETVEEGDVLFFGLVHGFEEEWGYFSLGELESAKGPLGLGIERDLYFAPTRIKDLPR